MEMQPLANPAMIGRTFGGGAAALAGAPMAAQNAYTRTMVALQAGLNDRAHAALANQQMQNLKAAEEGIQRLADPAVQAQLDSYTGQPGAGAVLYHLMRAGKLGDPDSIAKAAQVIQGLHMRTTAQTQGQAGNLLGMNVDLAAASGKPVKLAAVEGNTLVDPFSGQLGGPTAVGGSVIGKNNADATLDVARSLTEGMKQKGTLPARPRAMSPTDLPTVLLNAGRAIATMPGGIDPKTGLPIPGHVDPARMSAYLTAAYKLHQQNPKADPLQVAAEAAHAVLNPPAAPVPTHTPAKAPAKGAVEDGYRFMGGNPNDPASWKKV